MAQLKYCDKHNQVGFLRKPDESTGFAEIVDFLRGSNLRYALTANPPIYDSLVKQFWQSAITTSNTDGSLEIRATIDTIRYTISEASIRDSLQLDDATGITMLPNADLFEGMGQIGYPTDGTFTFWKSFFTPQWRFLVHHLLHCISSKSGGWDQFGSNIATALICLSSGRVYNFSKLIFDGMVANLKSKTKFLMYPRFLQMILNIQTENKTLYLAVSLTKKIFGNMKRGFRGAPRPLLPSMLLVATNPNAGQEHAAVAQSQPSSSTPHTPTPPPIPTPTPPPIPTPTSPPPPPPETEPTTDEHIYEEHSPVHHHFSPSQEQAPSHMPMDDEPSTNPTFTISIDSLELDLKQTKLTMGNAIVKLVKKVKKLEGFMKKRNLVLTDSEEEEPEAQGRKSQDDPQDSSVQGLVTPPTTKVNTSGEELVEEISLNTLEATKTLSKVASLKPRSIDKGRIYKRRKETKGKFKPGSIKLNTGTEEASTHGKDTGTKRMGKLLSKEEAEQIHLDALLAQRLAEEEELTEQQKKRKAQVQFEAQHYTNEDWDLIRAKLKLNASCKEHLGNELQGEDLAKRIASELNVPKRLKEDKDDEAKDDEPTKKSGKRRKQIARKGMHTSVDKNDSEDSDKVGEQEETGTGTETPINPVPVAMKTPSVATYKIIKQGEKGVYQIVREDGTDIVYINFGAMMKSISRDDLTELYRIVMNRYGMDGPEDKLEKGFWKCLRIMFEEPLSTDSIWSEIGQQKIVSWRYYDTCRVHCLNLESMDVYMLSDRKYPLSAEVCQTMLKMKLLDGKMNEDCYRLLKMMEKQAGIRK
ncbi:hypothetical protein Tco_1578152 [Tanacetum coccineum]